MRHVPLAVFLVVILLGVFAGMARDEAWRREKANDLDHVASLAAASVKHAVEDQVLAAETIAVMVRRRPGVRQDFDAFAADVRAAFPAISRLQVSPAAGGDAPPATPVTVVPDGENILVRKAVFLPGEGGERLWGFVSAIVHVSDLVRVSDLGRIAGHGYVYQLGAAGSASGTQAFAGQATLPAGAASRDIEVAGTRWNLSVAFPAPDGHAPLIWIDAVVAFALASLLAYLAHGAVSSRRALQGRVVTTSAQMKAVIDAIPDYIFIKDTDGVYLGCNKAYEARVGRTERELVGRTDLDFYPVEEAEFYRAKDRETLAAGEPMRFEESVLEADGGVRWFDTVKVPFACPSGKVLGMVGICREITARKRIEQQLRLSETVFQATSEGIVVTGPDTRIERVNDGFTRITGYSSEDAVGRTPRLLASGRQDASFYAGMWAALERDGHWEGEIWNRRKNGEIYPQFVCINAVRNTEGRVEHYVGVLRDITERKQAEMTLQEADRRKDEFLATLAHELRNPLAPLRNAAEVIRHLPQIDPRLRRIGEMMERQTGQATRLIEDLLDISRIGLGKVGLRRHRVELSGLVERAVETARPMLDARSHQLVMRLPEEPVWLDADDVRIVQVITNLLNNAAKYTQPGGRVELAGLVDGDEAVVRVEDNGDGIDSSLLPHVFELFRQGERKGTQSDAGGLGVGLALVGRLVALHGGKVQAHSRGPGCGSRFEVRLPLAAMPGAAQGDARPSPTQAA